MDDGEGFTSFISATTKTTSWSIVNGCLDDTVTYESSISPVEDSDSTVRKAPLVLRRPGPDSGPCEITLSFTQQHEIHQVYVRSTARVYEIYCAAKAKSDNEYLCTVRCGMAAKTEEVVEMTATACQNDLQPIIGGPSVCQNSGRSSTQLDEGETRVDSGSSSSEDGWIEVKAPERDGPKSKRTDLFMDKGTQDFYEATAEISDVDPCLSVTLRLLSVKSGESVYIDEIYVFADPFVSDEPDSPASRVENSTGNAMMSMLLPTILQISRARASEVQNKNKSDDIIAQGSEYQDTGLNNAVTNSIMQTEITPKVASHQETNSHPINQLCSEVHVQAPESRNKPDDNSCSRLESTLEQLVYRVARMESFCLGLEENLLKPVSCLETRLENIEKQLELLNKNYTLSSVHSCTRVSAPEFSRNDSESNTYDTVDNPKKDDFASKDLAISPSSSSPFMNGAQVQPGLVVTAPEFSYVDDEDEDDDLEDEDESKDDAPGAREEFQNDNVKKTVSIDDALASALAGLLSTAPSSLSTDATETNAATSFGEDRVDVRDRTAQVTHNMPVVAAAGTEESSGKAVCQALVAASIESLAERNQLDLASTDGIVESSSEKGREFLLEKTNDNMFRDFPADDAYYDVAAKETSVASAAAEETESLEADESSDNACFSKEPVQIQHKSITSGSGDEVIAKSDDAMKDVLNVPNPFVLNLDFPILDVKFLSQENSAPNFYLNDLLTDHAEVPCSEEMVAVAERPQDSLIEISDHCSELVLKDPYAGIDDHHLEGMLDPKGEIPVDSGVGMLSLI